jgi:heme/copper-type cytochrome/quinol oxidase subunit 3
MITHTTAATRAVGFWSAVLATAFSLTYVIAQLAEWAGWLGSAGGPESSSTPLGIVVLLTPSILLGSSFLVLLASIHQAAPPEKKIWSQAALAFGTVYAVLISMTYFVQLTLVGPRIAEGRTEGIEMLLFVPFDSFLYSVDLLGYSFMSAATLFAAPVFERRGIEGIARWLLIANGLLIPFLVGQLYVNALLWPATAWAITFPGATWALALVFRRLEISEPAAVAAGPALSPTSPAPRTAGS